LGHGVESIGGLWQGLEEAFDACFE
jgi:hypothetical protein